MLQITLVLCYIIRFSFTLFFRSFLTLLLWNRFSPGNLYSMALFSWLVVHFSVPLSGALFIIRSHFMWYLNSVTFLSRLIPTLFFP